MLIQSNIRNKTYALEVGKPIHKQGYRTGSGVIEFALVKPYDELSIYHIIEVSTGAVFVPDVGRLSKTSFENICRAFCFLGAEKLKKRINESKKVKDFPLWKEIYKKECKNNEG